MPIRIGSKKQLLIDDRFIESSSGVSHHMNTPVQYPVPVIVPDKPWEAFGLGAYNTAMYDEGRFRLWYDGAIKGGLPQEGARRLCYAESEDGIHFEKPELGLLDFRGAKANNIVAPGDELQSMQGATVVRDDRAAADERYRLWSKFRPTDEQVKNGVRPGLWAMRSGDGIRWETYDGQPNPAGLACDTQNMFFWDDRIDQFVGYTRCTETQHRAEAAESGASIVRRSLGSYRAVARMTSPDFKTWSNSEISFQADDEDLSIPVPYQRDDPRPNLDYYTSCAQKYPFAEDAYFMFPSAFYHWGEDDYPGTMDVQLLTSRDGIDWHRAGGREPFLRQGKDDTPESGMLFANPWLIPVGDELWFYYSAVARRHGDASPSSDRSASGIYRASIRIDGFISLDAGYGGGEFTTPLLQFEGNRLDLNLDGSAGGWLKVEILDEAGNVHPGFSADDSRGTRGNSVSKTVTWGDRSDISELADQPVRLRFVMRGMKLYSFQFVKTEK